MFALIVAAKREQRVAIKLTTGVNRRLSSEIRLKKPIDQFFIIRKLKKSFSKSKQLEKSEDQETESLDLKDTNLPFQAYSDGQSRSKDLMRDSNNFRFTYDYENGTRRDFIPQ